MDAIFLTRYSVFAQKNEKTNKAGLRSYAEILHNYHASFLLYCFSPYLFCMGFFISGPKIPPQQKHQLQSS